MQPRHKSHPALFFTGGEPGHISCSLDPKNKDSIDTTMVLGKSSVSISVSLSPTNSSLFSRASASNAANDLYRCLCDEAMYLLKFILCSVLGECTSQPCVLNQTKPPTVKSQGQT